MSHQNSPPASPVCSDTVSLPDTTSDLDNLSDYSGISISDEDDKHSRHNVESDAEAYSDGDFDEITHSMLASADLDSRARHSEQDQSSPKSSSVTKDIEKTPSASLSRPNFASSSHFNRRTSARDLAYPTPSQFDGDNLFGLNLNSLYRKIEEEKAIFTDQDLSAYSVLDNRGESIRHKYDRSVQTDSTDWAPEDSAHTILGASYQATIDSQVDEAESPFVGGGLQDESGECSPAPSHTDDKHTNEVLLKHFEHLDNVSLLTSWQRLGPKWLNKQTFGIFGVVLLGVAAFHVKTAPWLSTDTSALFLNASALTASISQSYDHLAGTTQFQVREAVTTNHEALQTDHLSHDPTAVTGAESTSSNGMQQATTSTPAVTTVNTKKVALVSLPSSVSALISRASSGLASLSTHVVPPARRKHRARDYHNHFRDIVASRQQGHHYSHLLNVEQPITIIGPANDGKISPLEHRTIKALSELPKKAQKGLSMLHSRSSSESSLKHQHRGIRHKQAKKSQVSRRTGKHWAQAGDKGKLPENMAHALDRQNFVDRVRQQSVLAGQAVRAPFSRVNAGGSSESYPSIQQGEVLTGNGLEKDENHISIKENLFLGDASALSKLSFGNLCKQLDSVLLPYVQQAVDTLNSVDYGAIWSWMLSTMEHCKRLVAPYVTTIDVYLKQEVRKSGQNAADTASHTHTAIQGGSIYSDIRAYLRDIDVKYTPVIKHYNAAARKKVGGPIKLAEKASRVSAKKAYGKSRAVLGRASRNARKMLNRGTRDQHRKRVEGGLLPHCSETCILTFVDDRTHAKPKISQREIKSAARASPLTVIVTKPAPASSNAYHVSRRYTMYRLPFPPVSRPKCTVSCTYRPFQPVCRAMLCDFSVFPV